MKAILFYSKYDHYGALYYEISRHNEIEKLERIKGSVRALLYIQYALFEVLLKYSNDDFVQNKLIEMDALLSEKDNKS